MSVCMLDKEVQRKLRWNCKSNLNQIFEDIYDQKQCLLEQFFTEHDEIQFNVLLLISMVANTISDLSITVMESSFKLLSLTWIDVFTVERPCNNLLYVITWYYLNLLTVKVQKCFQLWFFLKWYFILIWNWFKIYRRCD